MSAAAASIEVPTSAYSQGIADLQADRFAHAETHFQAVLSLEPANADAAFMLGVARAARGDLAGARQAYEQALAADPQQIAARRELAVTLAGLGQTVQARANAELLSKRAEACGDACADAADLTAAVATVQSVIAPRTTILMPPLALLLGGQALGDPSYVQALRLINQGRYEEALGQLRTAQIVFGPGPDVLDNAAYAYLKLGRYDEADVYLRRALATKTSDLAANEYFGELLVQRGDMTGARHVLAALEGFCNFGCIETENLRQWIEQSGSPRQSASASRP